MPVQDLIHVAIVDNDLSALEKVSEAFKRYGETHDVTFSIEFFRDPLDFANHYVPRFDLVMLDIRMPLIDGLELAEHIRSLDTEVAIVFVTIMANMAVRGYDVDASGFVVKPVHYGAFESTVERALNRRRTQEATLIIKTTGGMARVNAEDITYVEVTGHRVVFHTTRGDYETWSSLRAEKARLPEESFVQCSAYALVNLKHVKSYSGSTVEVGDVTITLSRAHKKDYAEQFLAYYGEL